MVPVSTAAVVPRVKVITPGAGGGVTVGGEAWVGGMGEGVFGGLFGVGRGGIGVEVAVGGTDRGRVHPARRMPETTRERKIDQGLIWERGILMNIDMPLFKSDKFKSYHKTMGEEKSSHRLTLTT
jgi:hypothetical protein